MSSTFPNAIHLAESYMELSGKITSVFVVGASLGEMIVSKFNYQLLLQSLTIIDLLDSIGCCLPLCTRLAAFPPICSAILCPHRHVLLLGRHRRRPQHRQIPEIPERRVPAPQAPSGG